MIKPDRIYPVNLNFFDYQPRLVDFKEEVVKGLSQFPKVLPPKLFYDSRGSVFFEEITKLKEYYIPEVEKKLLRDNIFQITKLLGNNVLLIEPGSGSGEKAKLLLKAHNSIKAYMPIEISREFLLNSAVELAEEFPEIMFLPVCADYLNEFNLPETDINNRVVFFPGSSIGNYNPEEALAILKKFIGLVNFSGGLLIGVDLKKEKDILELAYNDSKGITAEFNLNLIYRIKNELKANIDINNFYHKSLYNEEKGRIEMYLVSRKPFSFNIDETNFSFAEGESIHTECSYKYTVDEFKSLGLQAGYKEHIFWTDEQNYFSVHYFKV